VDDPPDAATLLDPLDSSFEKRWLDTQKASKSWMSGGERAWSSDRASSPPLARSPDATKRDPVGRTAAAALSEARAGSAPSRPRGTARRNQKSVPKPPAEGREDRLARVFRAYDSGSGVARDEFRIPDAAFEEEFIAETQFCNFMKGRLTGLSDVEFDRHTLRLLRQAPEMAAPES